MRTINLLLILLATFLSTSCMTRLKVNVNVADRDKILNKVEQDLETELPSLVTTFKMQLQKGKELKAKYSLILDKYYSKGSKEVQSLVSNEKSKLDEEFKELSNSLEKIEDLTMSMSYFGAYDELLNTELNFLELYIGLQNFIIENKPLMTELDINLNLEERPLDLELEDRLKKLKQLNINTNRLRKNLLGDPLTYFVTKNRPKKDRLWKGLFNETKVSTFMGNSDVAILLRKNPDSTKSVKTGDYNNNFTIKGVRLDAEDVIQASFKTLNQSVNLFAAMQFPDLNLSSTNNTTGFPNIPSDLASSIGNTTAKEDSIVRKSKYLKEVRNILIEKIISEDAESKTDEELKNSLTEIQTFWGMIKTDLENSKTN